MENTRKRVQLVEHKGRGRPQGSLSKIAQEAREKAQATGLLPHEFLLSIARGEPVFKTVALPDGSVVQQQEDYALPVRIDAAKAAAPYYAPKISTVEVISGVPDAELDLIIAQLTAEAGVNTGAGGEDAEGEGT